jgi:hypothetical protein
VYYFYPLASVMVKAKRLAPNIKILSGLGRTDQKKHYPDRRIIIGPMMRWLWVPDNL